MKINRMNVLGMAMLLAIPLSMAGQKKSNRKKNLNSDPVITFEAEHFKALKWRNLGPYRGGRTVAATGVIGDPQTYYFGSVGGGLWKSTDAGMNWTNISDGFFKSGSVGAIAVAPSDKNVIYVGMGEHAIRGVMTSQGDGMYKSTDAGKTWVHIGLEESFTIAAIRVHPDNPDLLYVAVQGTQWSDSRERGVFKSADGGESWELILYVDEKTGAADLAMDPDNPRILYAGMWDHRRLPWQIRSGGEGSGIYKSIDGGLTWDTIHSGLPEKMGKVAVDVSPANSNRLYANIEAEGEKGGVYRSDDAGKSWKQVSKDRITVARAWYYIEIYADPLDPETVYVLNAPMLKSIDGGLTFQSISNPHSDQHDLWINPQDPSNMILANDGGACVSFNRGKSWSPQNNQPTAQFYRVITDDQFPYRVYGGQQDNSTVSIVSRTIAGGITERDWFAVAGGESAFLAFNNPGDPEITYGSSIQGFLNMHDRTTGMSKDIMAYPSVNLGSVPKDQHLRFNWNGPLIHNRVNPKILYQGGNKLLRSDNGGFEWTVISGDLTRNDTSKQTITGVPFTNEAAGGEVYNTISYIASTPFDAEVIWVGTDDGLVHMTMDEGKNWKNVSPPVDGESLVNSIEISPHTSSTVFLAVTRYKFDDLQPMIFITHDNGESWETRVNGLPEDNFVRVVREDPVQKGLLYAGTENGLYISFNGGQLWQEYQSNLPVCPVTDLTIKDNDLVASTSGRGFWILDDLSALQQSKGNPDTLAMELFAPKTTYRFSLGGGFEKGGSMGQNPMPGVTIDYYLPHDLNDTSEIKLEILDSSGSMIQSLGNKKPDGFKSWPGGPVPPKLIPAKPGLNRTNWDLSRESLPAVEGIFILGSLAGTTVGPGTYTLRLKYGDMLAEQEVELLADPRLKASEEDWFLQQELLGEIEGAIRDIHLGVIRMRMVRDQIQERLKLIEGKQDMEELNTLGENAVEAISAWENMLIQPKQKTFQDVINFENQLNAELNMLRFRADTYDPRLTSGVVSRKNELLGIWNTSKMEMKRIINEDFAGFNALYKELDLPVLIIPSEESN